MSMVQIFAWFGCAIFAVMSLYLQYAVIRNLKQDNTMLRGVIKSWERFFDEIRRPQAIAEPFIVSKESPPPPKTQ